MIKILFLIILSASSFCAQSANVSSTNRYLISDLVFFSKQETIRSEWAGTVQVRMVEDIVWDTTTDCNIRNVAIRNEDKHLLAGALSAKVTNKQVRLYVDDTLKVITDYCYLRALEY